MCHELVKLTQTIEWEELEIDFAKFYRVHFLALGGVDLTSSSGNRFSIYRN